MFSTLDILADVAVTTDSDKHIMPTDVLSVMRTHVSPRFFDVLALDLMNSSADAYGCGLTTIPKFSTRVREVKNYLRDAVKTFHEWYKAVETQEFVGDYRKKIFSQYSMALRSVTKGIAQIIDSFINAKCLDAVRSFLRRIQPTESELTDKVKVLLGAQFLDWMSSNQKQAFFRGYSTDLNWFRTLTHAQNRRGHLTESAMLDIYNHCKSDFAITWDEAASLFGSKVLAWHEHANATLKNRTDLTKEQPPLPTKQANHRQQFSSDEEDQGSLGSPSSAGRERVEAALPTTIVFKRKATEEVIDAHIKRPTLATSPTVMASVYRRDGSVLFERSQVGQTGHGVILLNLFTNSVQDNTQCLLKDAAAVAISGAFGDVISHADALQYLEEPNTLMVNISNTKHLFLVPATQAIENAFESESLLWVPRATLQTLLSCPAGKKVPINSDMCRLHRYSHEVLQILFKNERELV
jgi:hypothetical protein